MSLGTARLLDAQQHLGNSSTSCTASSPTTGARFPQTRTRLLAAATTPSTPARCIIAVLCSVSVRCNSATRCRPRDWNITDKSIGGSDDD